jgi:hypothetical protein
LPGVLHSAVAWLLSSVPWFGAPPEVAVEQVPPPVLDFRKVLPGNHLPPGAAASRYASFSSATCRAEVRRRKLAIKPAGVASNVGAPMRVTGPFHGVKYVTPSSKYGLFDCRLALALDDMAKLLAPYGVAEIHVDNIYRPGARLPGRKNKPSQHSYGLAVDIMALKLADGRKLSVEHDWHGERGKPPCGPEAEITPSSEEATLLRSLVCEVARQGLFHHLLTPNYDAAHRNHLHFDIKRGARELLVR